MQATERMVRTQIQFTREQMRRLRALARSRGVSVAETVRHCVDQALAGDAPDRGDLYRQAAALVGAFPDRDGATDLAAEHDRYLDEVFR